MKKFLPIVLVLALLGGGYGYMQWNKKHADVAAAKSDVAISPSDLLKEFNEDENLANSKYLDKVIEVEGTVKSINTVDVGGSVSLDTGDEMASVTCEFENASDVVGVKVGDKLRVKGLCSGKLIDVVLNRSAIVK
jgi:hypothetical protein